MAAIGCELALPAHEVIDVGTRQRRFAAFDAHNFRLYFVGQLLSTVGTWMQTFALAWLVLQLTGRSDRLGVAVALQFLPLLLFGAHAGVLADRVDNRKLLLCSSACGGGLAVGLGLLSRNSHVSIWWVYLFAVAFGCVTAVERPVMQAILFQLVGSDRLPSAIGINGTINTAGRLVGPAVAALVIATGGIAACFYANAISYVIVIGALCFIRGADLTERPLRTAGVGGLAEGFRYVRSHDDVGRPLIVMAVVGTLAYNFAITIPAMVRFGFDRGSASAAAIMSISAIGSITGGLVVAGLRLRPRASLIAATVGLGIGLTLFGAAPTYAWFIAACLPLGFLSSTFLTVDATVLQQATEPAMQGRVMSLHQIAWYGSTPVGALLTGWLIQISSPRTPFFVGAASAFACALVLYVRRPQAGEATAVDQPILTSS